MAALDTTIMVAIPSSQLVQSSVAEVTTANLSATKMKEIVITFPGTYRIKFSLGRSNNTNATYAAVYRNATRVGIQVASPQSGTGSAGVLTNEAFIEDIGGWKSGDACQLYIFTADAATTARCADFGIFGEYAMKPPPVPGGKVVL